MGYGPGMAYVSSGRYLRVKFLEVKNGGGAGEVSPKCTCTAKKESTGEE